MGREISHFLAGLIILVMINLTPTKAPAKVVRFTDSRGIIHIISTDKENNGKTKESEGKPPPGGGNLTQDRAPEPEAAGDPPPGAEPPAGQKRKGPPRDLGTLKQHEAALQASQRQPFEDGGSQALSQENLPESVPYTVEGDPFLNPYRPIMPVAAEEPPPVKKARPAVRKEGGIRILQDRRGVLHITNQADSPESGGRHRAAAGPGPAFSKGAASPPAIRPVSWQPDSIAGAAIRHPVRENGPVRLREPEIRRFQDRRGVWHITNITSAEPADPAASLAGRNVRTAAVQSRLDYPWLEAAGKFAAEPLAGPLTVRSRRDRQGVIHISNVPGRDFDRLAVSLAHMKKTLGPIIAEATRIYRLPPALVLAVIQVESNFIPQAVSPKGAMGLMQLMPGTADLLGVRDPFDPRENILAGCRYLRELLDRCQGSVPLALAAYNAGERRIVAAGYTIPDIKETRDFVRSVLERYYLLEAGSNEF